MLSDIRICFIGDSFVNGTGDPTHWGWTGRVCSTLTHRGFNVTHYNLGVRRETSADIALRWEREVDGRLPQGCQNYLVFSFGTNDTTLEEGQCRLGVGDSLSHARQILSLAQSKFPTVMIGPPYFMEDAEQNVRIHALSDRFASLCAQLNVPYLDLWTPLSHSREWAMAVQAGDGVHPNGAGYELIAELVQGWSHWWF